MAGEWGEVLDIGVEGPYASVIIESWRRSASNGLQRDAAPSAQRVDDVDLRQRLGLNARLIEIALPHLRWLAAWCRERKGVAYLVDRDGIVLHAEGDPDAIDSFSLSPGYDWSETAMGTNGAGTALMSGRPVAVVGCDHWTHTWHDATCLGAPIFDGDGTLIAALDVSTDVKPGDLYRLVIPAYVARAVSQEIATLDARRVAASKTMLLATVAHEIRQPLAAMRAALGVVAHAGEDGGPTKPLAVLRRQLSHLVRLVDDLTDLARITTGRLSLRQSRVDLREVLRDALESAAPVAADHGTGVVAQFSDLAIHMDGDPARLRQVFSNLLYNAIKHNPPGTTVRLAADRVEPDRVRVTVSDDGLGIPETVLPTLFTGVPHSTTDGMGLGLAVVKRLVELHKGAIVVEPGSNRGTVVTVHLPTAEP